MLKTEHKAWKIIFSRWWVMARRREF